MSANGVAVAACPTAARAVWGAHGRGQVTTALESYANRPLEFAEALRARAALEESGGR